MYRRRGQVPVYFSVFDVRVHNTPSKSQTRASVLKWTVSKDIGRSAPPGPSLVEEVSGGEPEG